MRESRLAKDEEARPYVFIDEPCTPWWARGKGRRHAMDAGNMLKPALALASVHLRERHHAGRIPQVTSEKTLRWTPLQKIPGGRAHAWKLRRTAILRGPAGRSMKCTMGWTSPTRPSATATSYPTATSPTASCRDKAIDLIDEAAAKIKIEIGLQARSHRQARPPLDPVQIEREAVERRTEPHKSA